VVSSARTRVTPFTRVGLDLPREPPRRRRRHCILNRKRST
jgi:hypothetical protein